MSNCKLCKRLVGSVSVSVVEDVLVINIPDATYGNCDNVCVAVLQAIPATVVRGTPVAITIGDGTVQYPVVRCDGLPVTQEYIGQGNVYKLRVRTTATGAIFKATSMLCKVDTDLDYIPV